MKNNERIFYGLVITTVIILIATIIGSKIHLNSRFVPDSFVTHSIMLLLSVIAIFEMRKSLNFNISMPKFKNVLKPIAIGVVLTIVINILMAIVIKLVGGKLEEHPLLSKMNPMQVLIFIFFYASIVEEILFRGFLLNSLKSLKTNGINIFKIKFSYSVIISALVFGLAHLVLINTSVGALFLLKVVLFATSLGMVAGYYQEKYDNTSYAIIVHMSGNFITVIGVLFMSMTT